MPKSKPKQNEKPTTMIRIYAEDAVFLSELKNAPEAMADLGVPYIRPKLALAVHYLVRTARCPECERLLPRGRCEKCDKAGM